jgi:hypothetical protein
MHSATTPRAAMRSVRVSSRESAQLRRHQVFAGWEVERRHDLTCTRGRVRPLAHTMFCILDFPRDSLRRIYDLLSGT